MFTTARRRAIVASLAVLISLSPAAAQGTTVEALLARVVADPYPEPYTMTANFTATATLNIPTGRIKVLAAGNFVESRAANGDPRRRKATITRLDVPLLLRPATAAIRTALTDVIEAEHKLAEFLPFQDIFIQEERGGGKYLLGGVRQDIVTEMMQKYGQQAFLKDPTARRAIARWLWSPSQRDSIVRSGAGPYMIRAVVDDAGLVHEATLYYDWGALGSRLSFVMVGGRPFWREVVSDTQTEIAGIGKADGQMVLHLTNHCLNCPPR
ncbi:MAG: hypothetical protein HY355_00405 [Armatimonadetes bacterium]|nr:hypothetical protein [Armatimonadota bacterium]